MRPRYSRSPPARRSQPSTSCSSLSGESDLYISLMPPSTGCWPDAHCSRHANVQHRSAGSECSPRAPRGATRVARPADETTWRALRTIAARRSFASSCPRWPSAALPVAAAGGQDDVPVRSQVHGFCSSAPVAKWIASSSHTAMSGVTCGRPSARTVETQNSSARSRAARVSSQPVATASSSLNRVSSSVTGCCVSSPFRSRTGRPATLDPNKRQRDGDEARERRRRQPERRREHVVPPASLPTAAEHRDHAAVVHSHGFVLRPATPIPTTPSL